MESKSKTKFTKGEELCAAILNRLPIVKDETQLQQKLAEWFRSRGISFERERRLSARDRPDFMVGRIAVELKIKGSTASVIRQLSRYAESEEVDELVLVTTMAQHRRMPPTINDKPVAVLWISPF